MRQLAFSCCLCCCLVYQGTVRAGEGEESDILAKARKAQMGSAEAFKADAIFTIRGTIVDGAARISFTGELVARGVERDRLTATVDVGGPTMQLTLLGGNHAPGDIGQIPEGQYTQYTQAVRALQSIRTTALATLLHGIPEKKSVHKNAIGARALVGLTVWPPAAVPFGVYYFDWETGVLIAVTRTGCGEYRYSGHSETTIGAADERVLRQAGLKPESAAISEFLRKWSQGLPTEEKIKSLIIELGDDEFQVREQASKELTGLGTAAVPALKRATKDRDAEIARRARLAIEEIGQGNVNATVLAAVRVLTRLKPANAAEMLMNNLALADEEVAAEIFGALTALARRDGKSDPYLERALLDTNAKKRAAAEAVLGKDGGAYLKKPGRRLFPEKCLFPAKVTILVEGKTYAEIEFADVQFFNRVEDKKLEKP